MIQKREFVKTVVLSRNSETTVKFSEDLQLTCLNNGFNWYNITKVKGDFEITKISVNFHDGSHFSSFNNDKNGFHSSSWSCSSTFYITTNAEGKEMCAVNYQLQIPFYRFRFLKTNSFYRAEFSLPGYDSLKFTYFVTKIKATEGNDIEICIKNPYDLKIQGKKGDYRIEQSSAKSINLPLLFGFHSCGFDKSISKSVENVVIFASDNEELQIAVLDPSKSVIDEFHEPIAAIDRSRPESVLPSQSSTNTTSLLQKIITNNRFADVYFITSDGEKIFAHRCILVEVSNIFSKIFEETSETPVFITVEDFNADIIQSALSFLYEKTDAINGKEIEVFEFAVKYGIHDLTNACCTFFEESVVPSNVCQLIQIAYSSNFDSLKEKCLETLVEKKKEIDFAKIANLPKNIIVDAFCL